MPSKQVKLQVNAKGSWRDVMEFDADDYEVPHLAEQLFTRSTHLLALRIIIPGDTAPLMTWRRDTVWTPWRSGHN